MRSAPSAVRQPAKKAVAIPCVSTLVEADIRSDPEPRFPLPTFYINRDCDTGRRADIESELRDAGMVADRVCAVDGLAVPKDLLDYFFNDGVLCSTLKPGEVGCYASHLKVLRTIVARELDYALVLEDDAVLPHDLSTVLADVLACVPKSWDFIHLCGEPRRAVKPIALLKHRGTLVRYSRIPGGTVGYLISRDGAKKFLTPSKRAWPVDTDFRRPWLFRLNAYGVAPRIIDHNEEVASPIQALGGRARKRRGLPIPSRHAWTGNPLHCPEALHYYIRALGPRWWAACWWHNVSVRIARLSGMRNAVRQLLSISAKDA